MEFVKLTNTDPNEPPVFINMTMLLTCIKRLTRKMV